MCVGTALRSIKKDDPSTFINWNTTTNDVSYKYTVVWEPSCESSETEMNLYQPMSDNEDANCLSLMQNNYENCKLHKSRFAGNSYTDTTLTGNNGGIGSSIISVGCVKYEFRATSEDSPGL
jgi:hypothetical protein